ncbi:Transposase, partial [Algoriphagus alkaliphilus]
FKDLFGISDLFATSSLFKWITNAYGRKIAEIDKVVDMFKNHISGVLNALTQRLSNAMAERLNGKIQELKTVGRGYRTFANFRSAILFFNGGLDLYPH